MIALFRRLAWLLGRRRFEAELGEELRIHEAMAAEQARHEGMPPDEAGFAARRRVGNRAQLAEAARDVWRPPALADLGQDLRYALRGLRRQPGYAAAAVVTLLLAIGATTALFSLLDALLLRPLPYRESDRMVQVWEHKRTSDNRENLVSPANFLDWRDRARSFEHLAVYTGRASPSPATHRRSSTAAWFPATSFPSWEPVRRWAGVSSLRTPWPEPLAR